MEYDLSNETLESITIDEIEDEMINEIIANDTRSRNLLYCIYTAIGLFD